MKNDKQEIYKTNLTNKQRVLYSIFAIILSVTLTMILKRFNDSNPVVDSFTTVLSIMAFLLTVKRCVEQWYIWTIVNALCIIMWLKAYLEGSHCFATILMWGIYFVLGIYFLANWNKELDVNND